jgi:hypothetical protein
LLFIVYAQRIESKIRHTCRKDKSNTHRYCQYHVDVNTDNKGQITNNGDITVYNQQEELAEKCKTLEIKIAVLEEKLCGKDKEIALLQTIVVQMKA